MNAESNDTRNIAKKQNEFCCNLTCQRGTTIIQEINTTDLNEIDIAEVWVITTYFDEDQREVETVSRNNLPRSVESPKRRPAATGVMDLEAFGYLDICFHDYSLSEQETPWQGNPNLVVVCSQVGLLLDKLDGDICMANFNSAHLQAAAVANAGSLSPSCLKYVGQVTPESWLKDKLDHDADHQNAD